MNFTSGPTDLRGWSVICLRPAMQQAAVKRRVHARGGQHVTLPGLRLEALAASDALGQALACTAVVFTSPAAVHFAARLCRLQPVAGQHMVAVGEGTARALARHHIRAITPPPTVMHSEGVLALPTWDEVTGPVGLVTAPGGRGVIDAGLAARGFQRVRAEVYQRLPPLPTPRQIEALRAASAPRAVLVTSGEALDGVLAALPASARALLQQSVAVCSSPRLAQLAANHGLVSRIEASAPTTSAMLDALSKHAATQTMR
ncbi:MAG TPA: uroporphyrinogen-III synthase [Chiayiivirga sp.]|nr:uroporphyrinogen-III synthase [Chiayiivirga sp.]